MVTDYSSVFFDFAYMKKPIVYYQFDNIHYKKGYFEYERDGFGPIYNTEDKVVKQIEDLVKNDFTIDAKYKARIEKCFGNMCGSNCERIYNEILAKFEYKSNLPSSSSIYISSESSNMNF